MAPRSTGASPYPGRRVVPYTTPEATAAEAAAALAYFDAEVYVDYHDPLLPVCCVRRGQPREAAEFLLPGSQLVTGVDGGWRIEAVPAKAATS